ncbi:MAG TPA: helix-turn-helix transcriptional regulator [Acidobacteriota bacterium]|nr:helix-turn-helix transcriptional regulator [Acidobacteriota bacterium]
MGTEEESLKTLGERLREQREMRKISLDEISKVTKISVHLLHAMENDNWDALPGGIFTRNFIRLYANHLGLDAERWVEEFKELEKQAPGAPEAEETKEKDTVDVSQSWLYFLLVVVLLLLVGGYFAITRMSPPQEPISVTPEPVRQEAQQINAIEEPATAEEGLRLELTETEDRTFWFKWWADDQLQTSAEGASTGRGNTIVMEAREKIELHMNHYRSIDARLNGRKLDWETMSVESRIYEGGGTTYTVVINLETLK